MMKLCWKQKRIPAGAPEEAAVVVGVRPFPWMVPRQEANASTTPLGPPAAPTLFVVVVVAVAGIFIIPRLSDCLWFHGAAERAASTRFAVVFLCVGELDVAAPLLSLTYARLEGNGAMGLEIADQVSDNPTSNLVIDHQEKHVKKLDNYEIISIYIGNGKIGLLPPCIVILINSFINRFIIFQE